MGCGIGAINFYSQKVASRAENYWQESKSVVSLKYKDEITDIADKLDLQLGILWGETQSSEMGPKVN